MSKGKSKSVRFYPSELTCVIVVDSDASLKIYRLLEDALFEEFNTTAVLSRTHADEDWVHFSVKVALKDQEKLQNLILKFCQEQRLSLLQSTE